MCVRVRVSESMMYRFNLVYTYEYVGYLASLLVLAIKVGP